MKKSDKQRQRRLQKKREKRAQSRKSRTYNPQKHHARYQHQDSQNSETVEL